MMSGTLEWFQEFQSLVAEYLDTEGNTPELLHDEFDNVVENANDSS